MITLDQAQKVIEAATKKAIELGITVSVAVVDDHGDLIAFERMDGALKISPKFAQTKAYTSAMLGLPTGDMAPYAVEGKPYHDINSIFAGELTTIAGGMPIMIDGKLEGGIGVGGSMDVSQDAMCAQEGLKAIE